jgi:hypothetical protein
MHGMIRKIEKQCGQETDNKNMNTKVTPKKIMTSSDIVGVHIISAT